MQQQATQHQAAVLPEHYASALDILPYIDAPTEFVIGDDVTHGQTTIQIYYRGIYRDGVKIARLRTYYHEDMGGMRVDVIDKDKDLDTFWTNCGMHKVWGRTHEEALKMLSLHYLMGDTYRRLNETGEPIATILQGIADKFGYTTEIAHTFLPDDELIFVKESKHIVNGFGQFERSFSIMRARGVRVKRKRKGQRMMIIRPAGLPNDIEIEDSKLFAAGVAYARPRASDNLQIL